MNTATLTTSNTSQNGATVSRLNTNDVSIVNDAWDITVSTQIGFHMLVNLSSTSWGFHPTLTSHLTYSINSTTPETRPDKDLVISFSVDDSQYFTIILIIDNHLGNGRWPDSNDLLATGSVNSIVNQYQPYEWVYDRQSKASGGTLTSPFDNDNYDDDVPNAWPISISIENRPSTNLVYVSLQPNAGVPSYIQSCLFTTSFQTEQGMQIYIGGDDNPDDLISITQF